MADGRAYNRNEARAMRILEIMNDFRTLQHHISSLITRAQAVPANDESQYLDGYVILRQSNAEAQAILALIYNQDALGLDLGHVGPSEVQKAILQRIILDASTRRFQAHKIYLRAAAAMRWVQTRNEVLARVPRGERPSTRIRDALRVLDRRLREEYSAITDEHVVSDLRGADRRKGYWLDEDPNLERMLAWIRRQR